jgi:hypothetical protein
VFKKFVLQVLHRIEDIISLQQQLTKCLGFSKSLDYKPPRCHFYVDVKPPSQEKFKKPTAQKRCVIIYKLYVPSVYTGEWFDTPSPFNLQIHVGSPSHILYPFFGLLKIKADCDTYSILTGISAFQLKYMCTES